LILDLIRLHNEYSMVVNGVIHVGGHFGKENIVYSKLNYANKIFFEPVRSTFNALASNVNDAKLCNVALGAERGKKTMYTETANDGQSSSILKPKLHLQQYPNIQFTGREEVIVETLDDMITDKSLYNFINVDVQGYELEVFRGGRETLKSIDYVMCEVNRDELYEECCRVEDIDQYLSGYGLSRVETNWLGNTWGDAFYIKNK